MKHISYNPNPNQPFKSNLLHLMLLYLAIGSLLAAPLWAAFIISKDPAVAALCLLGEYLTAECWFGPTLASLFQVVPRDRRGTAQVG